MHVRALLIILFFISNACFSQAFDYSYVDPCTGSTKTIQVPSNGVTVTYYGQIHTFQPNDFNNGVFDSWANDVYSSLGSTNPCSAIVGLPTAITITQGTVYTTLGIINSLTTLADLTSSVSSIADVASGTTNILGGSIGTIGNSNNDTNSNGQGKNTASGSTSNNGSNQGNAGSQNNAATNNGTGGGTQNQGNTNPAQTNTNATGNQSSQSTIATTGSGTTANVSTSQSTNSGSGTAGSGSTNQPQNSSEQSSNSSTGQPANSSGQSVNSISPQSTNNTGGTSQNSIGSNNSGISNNTKNSEQGETNITAGGTGTIASSNNSTSGGSKSAAQKESGGKPTVIASSDFVGFNFKNSDVTTGIKATGGYTSLRWDGGAAHGILADYTSANKGPNITAFQAWIKPKSTTLVSGTLTVGFEGYGSQYITAAVGQVRSIKKVKIVYMATCSIGKVYKEAFIGTAVIAGGMYDFKLNKRFNVKIMNLLVYAPYVSYMNDMVMKSPYVMIPSIGTNIGITKRFKFNINMGSTMQINDATMNYTITCGTRLML